MNDHTNPNPNPNQPNHIALTDDDVANIIEGTLPPHREATARAALAASPALVQRIAQLKADKLALQSTPNTVAAPQPPQAAAAAAAAAIDAALAAGTWPTAQDEHAVIAHAAAPTDQTTPNTADLPIAKIHGPKVERSGPSRARMIAVGGGIAAVIALATGLIITGANAINTQPPKQVARAGEDYHIVQRDANEVVANAELEAATNESIDAMIFGDDRTTLAVAKLSPDRAWKRYNVVGLQDTITTAGALDLARQGRLALIVPLQLHANLATTDDLLGIADWTNASAQAHPRAAFMLQAQSQDIARIALLLDTLDAQCRALGAQLTLRSLPPDSDTQPTPVRDRDVFWWTRPATEWAASSATLIIEPAPDPQ